MNFLELHNKVLDRLRENRIVSTDIGRDPYINSISAHINDAKDSVENAYNWSMLRGEDTELTTIGEEIITISGSADLEYLVDGVSIDETGNFIKQVTGREMIVKYVNDVPSPVPQGSIQTIAPYFDSDLGEKQFRVYPRPDSVVTLRFLRLAHQPDLENYDDILKVPSTPVFTLATALASRERGEVGGTPTSELFAIAQTHLSDAIAIDTARNPEEQIWYVSSDMSQTNVRFKL
jgi:hypothetical protein